MTSGVAKGDILVAEPRGRSPTAWPLRVKSKQFRGPSCSGLRPFPSSVRSSRRVIILSLTVVGAFSFGRLGLDRFPKVDFPTVVVTTRLPGAAPEEVETEITDKIEEAVNTISGIDELRSTSSEGVSQVIVAFLLEKNADIAAQEVRDRVNRVLPLLPQDDRPADGREVRSGFRAGADPRAVRRRSRFATSPSTRTRRCGGSSRASAASARSWSSAAAARQINICARPGAPPGLQPDGHRRVARAADAERGDPRRPRRAGRHGADAAHPRTRAVGRSSSATSSSSSARDTRSSCATWRAIEDGMAEPDTRANLNGEPTVLLTVRRQSGTNTVQVVDAVKERLRRPGLDGAPGLRDSRRPRSVRVHQGVDQERRGAPDRRLDPGGRGRARVPVELALDADRGDRDPDVDHRHLRPDLVPGLHAELDDDARADARRRHRHRRRDRRAREHLPVRRGEGASAGAGGDRGDARDRPRRARDDAVAGGDLHPRRLHGRHRRPLHDELRLHDGVRDPGVAAGQLHADADAVGAVDQDAAAARGRRRPRGGGALVEGVAVLPAARRRATRGCCAGR